MAVPIAVWAALTGIAYPDVYLYRLFINHQC
jgi:hypothetical protein